MSSKSQRLKNYKNRLKKDKHNLSKNTSRKQRVFDMHNFLFRKLNIKYDESRDLFKLKFEFMYQNKILKIDGVASPDSYCKGLLVLALPESKYSNLSEIYFNKSQLSKLHTSILKYINTIGDLLDEDEELFTIECESPLYCSSDEFADRLERLITNRNMKQVKFLDHKGNIKVGILTQTGDKASTITIGYKKHTVVNSRIIGGL